MVKKSKVPEGSSLSPSPSPNILDRNGPVAVGEVILALSGLVDRTEENVRHITGHARRVVLGMRQLENLSPGTEAPLALQSNPQHDDRGAV